MVIQILKRKHGGNPCKFLKRYLYESKHEKNVIMCADKLINDI